MVIDPMVGFMVKHNGHKVTGATGDHGDYLIECPTCGVTETNTQDPQNAAKLFDRAFSPSGDTGKEGR